MNIGAFFKAEKNFANNCCPLATIVCILSTIVASASAQEFNMNAMEPPEAEMHYSAGKLSFPKTGT